MLNPLSFLSRNILSNYIGVCAGFAITLLLTPFLIRNLGEAAFGIWIFANSIRQYFQLLEVGTNPAIIKLVAQYAAVAKKKRVDEIASSAFAVYIVVGLVSVAISFVLAEFALGYFQIPLIYRETSQSLILIMGINVSFLICKRGLYAILVGYHRFDIRNALSVSAEIFQAVITVFLVVQGFGLIALGLLMIITNILELILSLKYLSRYYSLNITFLSVSRRSLKEIFDFSFFTFITDLASRVAWNIDVLVIGYFLPISSVTIYIIGVKLAAIIEKLLNPIFHTFFPLASTWGAQKSEQRIQALMLEGTKITLLISLPLGCLMSLTGRSLITIWVGEQYLSGFPVLVIFLAIFIVSNMETTASQIQLGLGKLRFHTTVSVCSAIANFLLSILLISHYGIIGVALGTLIPNLISNIIFSIPYSCGLSKLKFKRFLSYSVMPPTVSLLISLSIIFPFRSYINKMPNIAGTLLLVVLFLPLFLLVYLGLFSTREERGRILTLLKP